MRRILQQNRESLFSVIPSEIIEDMNLKKGDKLDFRIENNHIIAIPVYPSTKMNIQAATHEPLKVGECIE